MKPPIRVTAGIIVKDKKVLLAKRPGHSHLGGLWEFPGGKIEPGESAVQCLKRELAEELKIEIDPRGVVSFDDSFYEYGFKRVYLVGMIVTRYQGEIYPVEHTEVRWVEIGKQETMALAPADVPLARRLTRYYGVTLGSGR